MKDGSNDNLLEATRGPVQLVFVKTSSERARIQVSIKEYVQAIL